MNDETFMGPVTTKTAVRNILSPPYLSNDIDCLKWRESIREWVHSVSFCAEGGDRREKGAAATLAIILYQSLEAGDKELV